MCEFSKTVAIGKQWPEYHALIKQLEKLPPGRSLWEGGPSLDKYGTPLALMLIPYWTKGRITTMEGVYFEASATTPYHFEAVASLVGAGENSNPVRGIPYKDQQSFDTGVQYLQSMGVNYFLAHNPTTKERADDDPRLTLIATSPDKDAAAPLGWNIYRVADAPLVEGLGVPARRRRRRLAQSRRVGAADRGPVVVVPRAARQAGCRERAVVVASRGRRRRAASFHGGRSAIPRASPTCTATDDSISFDVDEIGKPVLVKASYYPNWRVSGGEGPYRATPNFMVVVPTEKHVTAALRDHWRGVARPLPEPRRAGRRRRRSCGGAAAGPGGPAARPVRWRARHGADPRRSHPLLRDRP